MPDRISVELLGEDEADRRLEAFGTAVSDLRPFWPRVVPLFVSWMREQFESEGSWAGDLWAPLSPAYALRKMIRFPGRGILIAEGDLRQAASKPERRASATDLTLTIEDPKVSYHQIGTDRMPARPLLFDDLPGIARRQLEDEADDYVLDVARRLGVRID